MFKKIVPVFLTALILLNPSTLHASTRPSDDAEGKSTWSSWLTPLAWTGAIAVAARGAVKMFYGANEAPQDPNAVVPRHGRNNPRDRRDVNPRVPRPLGFGGFPQFPLLRPSAASFFGMGLGRGDGCMMQDVDISSRLDMRHALQRRESHPNALVQAQPPIQAQEQERRLVTLVFPLSFAAPNGTQVFALVARSFVIGQRYNRRAPIVVNPRANPAPNPESPSELYHFARNSDNSEQSRRDAIRQLASLHTSESDVYLQTLQFDQEIPSVLRDEVANLI
jgi:hypothetical protein